MSKQELKAYLKEPYSRILIPDPDGGYSAEILEFPGCFAEGETATDAIQNLEAAAEAWVEATLAQGLEIPEPNANQGYGGKIALRLPRNMHRQAARMAERNGTSLNQALIGAIGAWLGAEDLYTRLAARLEQRFASVVTSNAIIITNHNLFYDSPGLPALSDKREITTSQSVLLPLNGLKIITGVTSNAGAS